MTVRSFVLVALSVAPDRTCTVSLGICAIRVSTLLDLRTRPSVSDRESPLFAGVNGPLMARPVS